MKTACFFSYFGPGRISIARFAPRALAAGYRVYRPLSPGRWFNSVPYDEYHALFTAQLAALDAKTTWHELHQLVAPAEPVLLCWERPPLRTPAQAAAQGEGPNWCHRTMVAEWFKRELDRTVPELEKEAGRG